MTGRVYEKYGVCGFMHYEESWAEEIRCDWCFSERYKSKAELRVGKTKLCLPCWFKMAFRRKR